MKDKIIYSLTFIQLLSLFISALGYEQYKYVFFILEIGFLLFFLKKIKFDYTILLLFLGLLLIYPTGILTTIFGFFSYLFSQRLIKMDKNILSNILKFLITSLSFYMIFYSLRGINPNEFIDASRNHIGVPFIFFGSLNLYIEKKNNLKSYKTLYLLILFVCLWSVSRGNIISGSLLLLISIINTENFKSINFKKTIVSIISISIIIGTVIYNLDFIKGKMFEKSFTLIKFFDDRNSIIENERFDILNGFFNSIKDLEYIIGKNIDYNLHNSYVAFYAKYGIVSIVFIFYSILKGKKNIIYLLPILVRSFTDTLLFFNAELDFIFFYLAFI